MIEFKDGRYFAVVWFVGPGLIGGRRGDVHGALWRDPGGPWTLQYRYRYYVDARLDTSSEDEKSWYQGVFRGPDGEEELVQKITEVFHTMGENMGVEEVSTVKVASDDVTEVHAILMKQSWAHPQMTSAGGEA